MAADKKLDQAQLTWYERLRKNAALITVLLASTALVLTAIGVYIEETRIRKEKLALYRENFGAAIGSAFSETAPLECGCTDGDLWSDIAYESSQILLLNMSPRLGSNGWILFGRLAAIGFVVVLGIQAIGQLMTESFRNLRLMFWSCRGKHHIVCGLGRVGWPLVMQLKDNGHRILILERSKDNELIDDARKLGAIVLIGDATDEKYFELAHVKKAKAVYLVTGSDEENIEAAVDIHSIVKEAYPKDFRCYVHITDPALGDVLDVSLRAKDSSFPVQTFNVMRNSARKLIVEQFTAIRPTQSDEVALYILFGFGPMGQTLATHLAELAHFENGHRSRILIFTDKPQEEADAFRARWGQFTSQGHHTVVNDWSKIAFDPRADSWDSRQHHPAEAFFVDEHVAIEYAANAIFAPYPHAVADRTFLNTIQRLIQPDPINLAQPKKIKPALIFCREKDQESYAAAVGFYKQYSANNVFPTVDELPIYVWIPRQEPLKLLIEGQREALRPLDDAWQSLKIELAGHPRLSDPWTKTQKAIQKILKQRSRIIAVQPFGSCADELKLQGLENPREDAIGQFISGGYEALQTQLQPIESLYKKLVEAKSNQPAEVAEIQRTLDEAVEAVMNTPVANLKLNFDAIRAGWKALDEVNLNSNRMAAIHFEIKLRVFGYKLVEIDEPGTSITEPVSAKMTVAAIMEHNRWMAERLMAGCSYGVRSDIPARRTQLCAWEHLTTNEILKLTEPIKDYLQVRSIFANLDQIELKAILIADPAVSKASGP